MSITFRDLYNGLTETRKSFNRMDLDIDNVECGTPTCILTEEQQTLLDKYKELANAEVDFCELDIKTITEQINKCYECVTAEIENVPTIPLPEPEEVAGTCNGAHLLEYSEIRKFRIYERTYTHKSIPSPIQVYVFDAGALPYRFEPNVPEYYPSHEEYYVSWNSRRNSLVVKLDHDERPLEETIPPDSYNIATVIAELTPEARELYGIAEVEACQALVMTEGVQWKAGFGVDKMVDGRYDTYSICANNPMELVVEFLFSI